MAFTYFFRDLQTLEAIREFVSPDLRTKRYVNIWDAGCASGQEPYTLAIILHAGMGRMAFRNVHIHSSDIDSSNLFARLIQEAVYPEDQVKRIPEVLREQYFHSLADGQFQLIDEIRRSVTYEKHDLLSLRPIRNEFSLILCKNVLLHFQEQERIDVIRMFHRSLAHGGYLVTEQTQKLPDAVQELFTPVTPHVQIFRKL